MHTRPRIGLVFALAAAIGCGSITASHDASSGGTSGGGAGTGGTTPGMTGTAGTTGTGGGPAGAPGGAPGTAGRGGAGPAGAGGALTGAAGRGGAGGNDGMGRGGGPGNAGRGGASGGPAGTAGRGGTGGGPTGTAGTVGRGGTGGGLAGGPGNAGRGGAGGGLAGGPGNAGRGGTGIGGAGGRVTCNSDGDCQLFRCCDGFCVNIYNDVQNCGGCGKVCMGRGPFCNQGTCDTPPCGGLPCLGTEQCCGSQCCGAGQLCCFIEVGPGMLRCADPVNGTCPPGCMAGCPCTAPTTPIATPTGDRPISELRAGDLVYSVHHGAFAVVPIKVVHHTAVAPTHEMVEVRLAHGPVLRITPAHPTADGRTFGDLRRGSRLDGVGVESVRVVPYGGDFTYDILPDSDTGTYVAGGVLIGSALAGPVTGHVTPVDPVRSSRRASLAPALPGRHLTP